MNKKGLEFAKIVGIIIAVIVLILLILFAGKFYVLKDVFTKLVNSLGGIGG